MSLVDYSKIVTKEINDDIISYAKNILYNRLCDYILIEEEKQYIKSRISKINISLVSSEEFEKIYKSNNGKGFIPAAFVVKSTIYFKSDHEFNKRDFHELIHEMLHSISENEFKHGLMEFSKDKKGYRGYTINEACTEFLTSVLLEENFGGYSEDLNYMIQLLMQISNIDTTELINLYVSPNPWLNDAIIKRFNSQNKDLVQLVLLYDQRLAQTI